ncbi:hypothetical protein CWI36_0153p0030 [Hamiltosporidium magnivora]|uniref:Uncharacterized protein n=1 Tax=Hamiltosporidium magnivora TaxID=148818 RepID=A0A4Q9LLH3_9MICR|nr:hypothetical protein CWI36_0153p0030 [Hamiltosporidium magnivora]
MYDGLSESQRKKIASIVDFYFDHIKTYTDEYLHELLLHFSTLISTISCAANLENNMECILCFKEELTDSEIVLRIIVEFLFLTDILYIEFNKCKNTARVKSIENNFQTFLDSSYPCHHTVHEDVVIANPSLQHISLKTSNLIEISVIVETFSDQLFLDKLNTAIITKLEKTGNSTSKEGNMREFILYIKIWYSFDIVRKELPSITPNDNRDVMNDFIENELANILREEVRNYLRNFANMMIYKTKW